MAKPTAKPKSVLDNPDGRLAKRASETPPHLEENGTNWRNLNVNVNKTFICHHMLLVV
ncbi:Uncharacterised protein [Paenibacillus thiaminolyticus]|nr:Uncharacterised protein [Paenibacillus thiaminolyticus]